ncbi:DUF2793 domain-containing protein [Roseisalinus antarcticus]|uniref:Membrane transport protein n=1 Tax=Roseisalinus antarcticus TaxID=254357 RepID=A0A1Y5TYV5_9RHOB|nr:DUF2793 domain-containing protein [Roseisalinus antarcticus]SLN76986.1 Membrane transport protein [Roseisalinus antarcticus]
MSDTTTNLLLPYILAAQAQKHVTHNEALRILDGLIQLSVLDRDLTEPPGGPADGDRYVVASGGTGDWAGWDLNVAVFTDGSWQRLPPRAGWRAWVEDEEFLLVYDGSAWVGTTPASLQNLALLGLGGALVRYRPEGDVRAVLWVCGCSLVVHPAIAYGLGTALGLNTDALRAAVITAAMAPGINTYIFADMYGAARRVAASGVLIGTALSLITVWGWLLILP